MKLHSYIFAHIIPFLICLAVPFIEYGMMSLAGYAGDASALVSIVTACLLVIAGLYNWARERSFLRDLDRIAHASNDNALALASDLAEPTYAEGQIVADAMRSVSSASQVEVGRVHSELASYREFIETWVHEIKTPLAACELIIENLHDARLHTLSAELNRIDAYVEQALFYARSTSLEKDFVIRERSVESLVKEALKSRASQLINADVAVDLSGLSAVRQSVFCDGKWVVFILGQVIDNALRYRADPATDGRAPRISFAAEMQNEGSAQEAVVLSVTDNGCGIPAADLPRIFDKAFTGQNGRTGKKSTGIGLFLVRNLCRKMGLSVSAQSQVGHWTRISITFPRNRMVLLDA